MISENHKYRAEVFKIVGLAFLAPLGKLILGIPYIETTDLNLRFILYFVIVLTAAYFGIIILTKGLEIITSKIERK